MRNTGYFVTTVLIAALAGYAGAKFAGPQTPAAQQQAAHKESVYDRVLRTKTLRCGYINYPPHLIVDANSKKMSGITYDIMEEAARLLDIKIDWAAETGWATTVSDIQSGKVDAICTSFWQNPVEGRYLSFSIPLFYSGVGAYARADDERFGTDMSTVNKPDVTLATADGAIAALIAGQDYPQAKTHALPNMTDETLLLMDVMTGKADVTFIETYVGEKFNKQNGYALRQLDPQNPLRIFGNTIALPPNEAQLKTMLDSAFVQMLYGGTIDKILKKYEEVPNGIYRVAKPYQGFTRK